MDRQTPSRRIPSTLELLCPLYWTESIKQFLSGPSSPSTTYWKERRIADRWVEIRIASSLRLRERMREALTMVCWFERISNDASAPSTCLNGVYLCLARLPRQSSYDLTVEGRILPICLVYGGTMQPNIRMRRSRCSFDSQQVRRKCSSGSRRDRSCTRSCFKSQIKFFHTRSKPSLYPLQAGQGTIKYIQISLRARSILPI